MTRSLIFRPFAFLIATTIASLSLVGSAIGQTGYGSEADGTSHSFGAHSYAMPFGFRHYHASTAAEGFLRGKAAVIDSLGNFEVSDGQAQILREQARSLDRENDLKQTQALQLQKKMWSDARIQARNERLIRAAEGQKL